MKPEKLADALEAFANGPPWDTAWLQGLLPELAIRGGLAAQDADDKTCAESRAARTVDRVPDGWNALHLGDLLSAIQYGFSARADPDLTGVRFLRITDIQEGRVDWDSVPGCEIDQVTQEKLRLQDGDIVVARTGGTVGKSYLVDGLGERAAVFASYLIRLTPRPRLDPRYLKYFMDSPTYWGHIRGAARGAAQPNVNSKQLRSIELPLPPLGEQHRIVAKVDELMKHAAVVEERHLAATSARVRLRDAALHALAEAEDHEAVETAWSRVEEHFDDLFTEPDDIQPLRQTVLQLAVRGRLVAQEEEWTEGHLKSLVLELKPGFACSRKHQQPGGVVHLRTHNVGASGRFNTDLLVTIDPEKVDPKKRGLKKGDVIFNNTNSRELVGKSCVVPENLDYAFSNHMTLLRPGERIIGVFLWCVLQGYWRSRFFERTCKAWIGQAGIGTKAVGALAIPLPPLAEQHRIVAKVDELMTLCDSLEASLRRAKETREQFADSVSHALTQTD